MSPSAHVEQLQAEADYRRQRLDLYRAKVSGSHPTTPERLAELQRQYDLAAARLQRAIEAERGGVSPRSEEPPPL